MITGPIKVVIVGPPRSGKTALAESIAVAIIARAEVDLQMNTKEPAPLIAIYDRDNIVGPSNADIVIMTVECSPDQISNPADMLAEYQKRDGKI